jgi:hypothetical protein
MQVIGSVVKASAIVAASTFVLLQAMDWDSIALHITYAAMQVVGFVPLAHPQELLALLLWLILLIATIWVKTLPLLASNEGPPPFFPCNQRCATKKAQTCKRRQVLAQRSLSTRSAGLHRSYPLCL